MPEKRILLLEDDDIVATMLETIAKTCRQAGSMISRVSATMAILSATFSSVVAAGLFLNSSQAASDVPRQLEYRVQHSVFGEIGTYTNTIEPKGDTTIIRTTVHLNVSALGVVLYHEDAERTERWRGDILRDFHGITTKNGVATEVDGRADGNVFVVLSPSGKVIAPATIRPSNPWSSDFLKSTTMMLTDTGAVEKVRVGGGETTLVQINGNSIWARKYRVDGSLHYKIWIDDRNIPVAFAVDDDSGEVSFTLMH